jgi:L-type amino acid transporter 9
VVYPNTPQNFDLSKMAEISPAPVESTKTIRLKRTVGPLGGVSFIVGLMIGSGIFASARWVMVYSGSVGMTLVVWSACGVLSMFGALSYLELGLAIPKSGGDYSYLREGFGELSAFMFCWTSVLILRPSSLAIILLAFASYVIEAVFPGCSSTPEFVPLTKLLAASAIGKQTKNLCAKVCWGSQISCRNCKPQLEQKQRRNLWQLKPTLGSFRIWIGLEVQTRARFKSTCGARVEVSAMCLSLYIRCAANLQNCAIFVYYHNP